MMTLKEARIQLARLTDEYREKAKALKAYIRVLESQGEEE